MSSHLQKLVNVLNEIGIPFNKGIDFNIVCEANVSKMKSMDTFVVINEGKELKFNDLDGSYLKELK